MRNLAILVNLLGARPGAIPAAAFAR